MIAADLLIVNYIVVLFFLSNAEFCPLDIPELSGSVVKQAGPLIRSGPSARHVFMISGPSVNGNDILSIIKVIFMISGGCLFLSIPLSVSSGISLLRI